MDDRAGVALAGRLGLEVIGTLGVLRAMAEQGWTDLGAAYADLAGTNFHVRRGIMEALLAEHRASRPR